MRELFKMADANKDGCLDYQECVRMFRSKGVKISEADIRKLFDKADRNKDGKISPSELVDEEAAVEDVKGKSDVAFRLYDRNKDGSISKQEMMSVPGGKLTKQQARSNFVESLVTLGLKLSLFLIGGQVFRGQRHKRRRSPQSTGSKMRKCQ